MSNINITGCKDITVTCHAGAMNTENNTVASIEKLIELDAEIVEFDVSFRPDGTPVMIHKEKPESDEGELISKALAVVAKSGTCKINLDLKNTSNLPVLEKLIKEYKLFDRVFYTGVSADWVDAVKATSTIPYYLNHAITEAQAKDSKEAQAVADKAKALGAIGINSRFTGGSRQFTDIVHGNGLLVSYWTPNTPEDIEKVIAFAPDNITSEHPDLAAELLQKA